MSVQDKEKPRPKGAMSAYAYFVQVIREEHKRKHPGEQVVFSEFSKKCAEKWKVKTERDRERILFFFLRLSFFFLRLFFVVSNTHTLAYTVQLMTPKEKKRFEEMAASDKDRFNREMNNYQPPGEGGRRRRKRRRIKEPGQPKRAWSAFFFFCDEFRPKVREAHPDWRVGNIAKELGRLWESCTDKEKYEKKSEADKQRYEEVGFFFFRYELSTIIGFVLLQQMSQFRAGQYVPPVKRPRADSNGSALVAGSSSTEDPTAVSTDAPVIEDEDLEDEEEYDEEVDETAEVDDEFKKTGIFQRGFFNR